LKKREKHLEDKNEDHYTVSESAILGKVHWLFLLVYVRTHTFYKVTFLTETILFIPSYC
jgi:hypothetical protein